MKELYPSVLLVFAVLANGCSKSEAPAEPDAASSLAAPEAPQDQPPVQVQQSSRIHAALESVAVDMRNGQYTEAAGKLAALKQMPMSPEDRREFDQLNQDFNMMLVQKAQTDPKAQEAYQAYGRMMLGR